MSSQLCVFEPPEPPELGELGIPDILDLLGSIVSSAEPAVVFQSVAQLCVPMMCAAITVAIFEPDEASYTIASPHDRAVETGHTVMTGIRGQASLTYGAYEGALTMTFVQQTSTQALLGQLVVDRAVALVHGERLGAAAESNSDRAENLAIALRSSRDIGIAMGIIMSRHQLTEEHAFNVLIWSSQDTQRKIREVARDVAHTGEIDLPQRALLAHPPSACRPGIGTNTASKSWGMAG